VIKSFKKYKSNTKKLTICWSFLVYFLFQSGSVVFSSSDRIDLIHADKLVGGESNDSANFRTLFGKVHLKHKDINLFSSKAEQSIEDNIVDFSGNVKIKKINFLLLSDYIEYYGFSQMAYSPKEIAVFQDATVLNANNGSYDLNADIASFKGDVTVQNDTMYIEGDYIEHHRKSGNSFANGNVIAFANKNNAIIESDTLNYYPEDDYANAKGYPCLFKIDTTFSKDSINSFRLDTISISSKKIDAYFRSGEEKYIFTGNINIFRDNLVAKSNKAIYLHYNSQILLYDKPVVWYEGNQLISDSIVVYMLDNKIKRIEAYGSSLFIMQNDSIFTDRIDQLYSESLTINFIDGVIKDLECIGAAKNLYFYKDEYGLIGADRSSTQKIFIEFDINGKPECIDWIGGTEKEFINAEKIAGDEKSYYLPNFILIEKLSKKTKPTFSCD